MPNTQHIPYRQIFWWTLVAALTSLWLNLNMPQVLVSRAEWPVAHAIATEFRPGPFQLLVAATADWMASDDAAARTWYRKAAEWIDEIHEGPVAALPEPLWAPQAVRERAPEEIALLAQRGLVLPAPVLVRYVGTYRGPWQMPLLVEARDGKLVAQLAAVKSDLFVDVRYSGRAFTFPQESRYDLEMLDGVEMRHYNRASTNTDHPA